MSLSNSLLEVALALIPLIEGARGDPRALNPRENALGIYQITPILVRDLRERGYDFSLEDRVDPARSRQMAEIYLRLYATEKRLGRPATLEDLLLLWCAGPDGPLQPRNRKMETYLSRGRLYYTEAVRRANAKMAIVGAMLQGSGVSP